MQYSLQICGGAAVPTLSTEINQPSDKMAIEVASHWIKLIANTNYYCFYLWEDQRLVKEFNAKITVTIKELETAL